MLESFPCLGCQSYKYYPSDIWSFWKKNISFDAHRALNTVQQSISIAIMHLHRLKNCDWILYFFCFFMAKFVDLLACLLA